MGWIRPVLSINLFAALCLISIEWSQNVRNLPGHQLLVVKNLSQPRTDRSIGESKGVA